MVLAKAIKGYCESEVATATYTFAEAYEDITLADLVNKPVDDTKYNITDLTCINVIDNAGLLICKDENGYAPKDVTENGWIDYMQQVSGLNVPETYDQSNWIALRLPQGTAVTNDMIHAPLSGVKGHLVNANNLEFQLDAMPDFGSRVTFTPNTYIPASFKGTQESANGKTYFFVQPKPMEYATVTWSKWDGERFVVPSSDNHPEWNQAGLTGQFDYKGDYLEQDPVELQSGHTYEMRAVVKHKTATGGTQARAPRRAEGEAKQYVVYPLTIDRITQEQNGVITGVQQLSGDRQVMHVDYYNVSGMRSERPWQGVNIVVTRYSDGTTSAVKMLR